MRTILEIEENESVDLTTVNLDTRDLQTLEDLEEKMFVGAQPLFSGSVEPLINNLEREFVADYAHSGKVRPFGANTSTMGAGFRAAVKSMFKLHDPLGGGEPGSEKYSETERAIIAEFEHMREALRKKRIVRGLW